jgi:hypothetical protein
MNAVQGRNSEMVNLLSPDFIRKNDSAYIAGIMTGIISSLPGIAAYWPMSISLEDRSDILADNVGAGTTFPEGIQSSVVLTESSKGFSNIRMGEIGGDPRLILDDGSNLMQLDNSSGTFRIFKPGTVLLTLNTNGNLEFIGRLGSAWSAISFGAGWGNWGGTFEVALYKKAGDIVMVTGLVTRVSGVGTVIGTLPVGFRPVNDQLWDVITDSGLGRVDVDSSGNLNLVGGGTGWVSLFSKWFSLL